MKINNLKVKESFKNIAITTTLVVSIETSLVLSKGYVNYKNYNDSKNYNFGYATSDYAPVITNIVNNGNEYQVELLYPVYPILIMQFPPQKMFYLTYSIIFSLFLYNHIIFFFAVQL